jgi:tRNA(Ile)-lysidine synthase TilS/MesJ
MNKEDRRFADIVLKKVGRAVNTYGLAGAGDRIAVGLSGGMDSLVLLETLATRLRHIPISYEVMAVHVKVEQADYVLDQEGAGRFCRDLGVPFHYLAVGVDLKTGAGETACFPCSMHRRRILFDFMREHRCTRLALGHHMDDVVETLLLNMVYQGNISTMPPRLPMFGGEFDIIRPLTLLTGDEVERYAGIRGLLPLATKCSLGEATRRHDMRRIIDDMNALNGNARHNLFAAMSNIRKEYLPGG